MWLVIFKRVLLGDGPVKEFQSPISKCDACVRSDGRTQPLVNSGQIAVLGVVVCFGVTRWGPFIFHWGTYIVIPILIGDILRNPAQERPDKQSSCDMLAIQEAIGRA